MENSLNNNEPSEEKLRQIWRVFKKTLDVELTTSNRLDPLNEKDKKLLTAEDSIYAMVETPEGSSPQYKILGKFIKDNKLEYKYIKKSNRS
jgi:hypothetical protein